MKNAPAWIAVWLTVVACADGSDPQPTHTVIDSAGITIVHSFEPDWGESGGWTIAPEPYLQIGAMEGEEPYLLDRVVGVASLEDGRIAIAMGADNTIRFYSAQGEYLSRVGGSGGGPGEFSRLNALHRTPGRLYGRQLPPLPINVFDEATGAFLETVSPPDIPDSRAIIQGVFNDGSILFRADLSGEMPASGSFDWTTTLLRDSTAGSLDTVGTFPAQTFVTYGGGGASTQQFGPNLELALDGDGIYLGHSSRYEIGEYFPDGSLRTLIRREGGLRPVTNEDVARRKEEVRSRGADDATVEAMIYPENHPAFVEMLVDRAGNIWAQRPNPQRTFFDEMMGAPDDAPAPWDVFSPEGVWLGTVEQPARFRIREIGDDYVAGVWVDEFDVEYVRFYEIRKPRGG